MSRRFLIVAVTILLVGAVGFPSTAFARPNKVDICHFDADTGMLERISVPESTVPNHLAHGDVLIGDGVDENCDPGATGATGLADVLARGYLNCGISGFALGFSLETAPDVFEGLDVDMCRVVAAAVLGDADDVQFIQVTSGDRFAALREGDVDVLMRTTTNTLRRDALLATGGEGVNFGPTYFYDGSGILAHTTSGISALADLGAGKTVCVVDSTTTKAQVAELAAEQGFSFTTYPTTGDLLNALDEDTPRVCDAGAFDRSALPGLRNSLADPEDWTILVETFSKEPLAPVVADGDDQWAAVVRWSVYATFQAEEIDATPSEMAALTSGLGSLLGLPNDWAYDIVDQVGDYGDIYAANLEPVGLVRAGSLNDSYLDGGLIYSPLFR